ncbi:MAG: sigma-54 dependent transcriptional regulator [Nitrospiraceae bacterium]|nr:sigma-54 dependent transcriptional regulator [Nitrospiraceae bacterium]
MAESYGNVLIVDDEPNAVKVLSAMLSSDGYNIFKSYDARKALDIIRDEPMDAIITDLRMPEIDGMQLFEYVKQNHPDIPVIFLTAYGTVESAVHSITKGAYYYFIKPPDYTKLRGVLSKAVRARRTHLELAGARGAAMPCEQMPGATDPSMRIIGKDPALKKILETVESVRDTTSSVLITGETGTGKELIAKALHYGGVRKVKPFVAVNCAAIPRELLESELFGYEKGAFTNAVSRRIGRFEEAATGTIFLDEITELGLPLQAKLLRVLQEREVERLGGGRKIKVDFRLVSSTNRDLEKDVQAGTFRMDLYYRINVVHIWVPPLRLRKDDIPQLAAEFVGEFSEREKKTVSLSEEVLNILCEYSWPGNIRQLRNVLERVTVLSRTGRVSPDDLPEEVLVSGAGNTGLSPGCPSAGQPAAAAAGGVCGAACPPFSPPATQTLREIEEQAIIGALEECRGNKSKAAKLLGISRKTFYKRLREISPSKSCA